MRIIVPHHATTCQGGVVSEYVAEQDGLHETRRIPPPDPYREPTQGQCLRTYGEGGRAADALVPYDHAGAIAPCGNVPVGGPDNAYGSRKASRSATCLSGPASRVPRGSARNAGTNCAATNGSTQRQAGRAVYAAACARFTADPAARTCGKCAAVHPEIDLASYGWPTPRPLPLDSPVSTYGGLTGRRLTSGSPPLAARHATEKTWRRGAFTRLLIQP